ncbi:MAG: site-2 protease family protein [Gemmatimonadetes bacterium]|nr:site-2 protease family protein [Gemmatimonadota bacterium]
MKWASRIGTFAGISVYVHATFLLLIIWIGVSYWRAEQSIPAVVSGIVFILALFGCVVLHEFGHALTARRYGIRTRDITLFPIGGVARLERMPDDPRQELLVAVAGPAVNVVIAALLFVVLAMSGTFAGFDQLSVARGSFLERLMLVNIWLVVFNLIPAFPMDGGRMLRAALAMRMDYARATRSAANLGQGIALLFGLVGLMGNPFLVFIALFVWIGAAQESAATQMKFALSGTPLTRAMMTVFRTLSVHDTLGAAVSALLAGSQQDFPVLDDGRVVGVLTRTDLLAALAREGDGTPVTSVMQRAFIAADPSEMLDTVFERLQACTCRTVPVVRGGQLVGLVTMENVGEFVSVQAALGATRRAQG